MKGLWVLVGLLLLLPLACALTATPTPAPTSSPTAAPDPTYLSDNELRKLLGLPTEKAQPSPAPKKSEPPKTTTPLGLKDRVRQASEVAETVAFLEDEFRRFSRAQKRESYSDFLADVFAPSAVYGFLMAPFLRPELSAQAIDRLTMAQFLPQGLASVPTAEQINQALMRAGSADPRTLTKAQAELAQVLRRPESNELVFQIATAPFLAQLSAHAQDASQRYLEGEFGKFQSQNPNGPFLKALVAGFAPFGGLIPGLAGGS